MPTTIMKMLSVGGNPTARNLGKIVDALASWDGRSGSRFRPSHSFPPPPHPDFFHTPW